MKIDNKKIAVLGALVAFNACALAHPVHVPAHNGKKAVAKKKLHQQPKKHKKVVKHFKGAPTSDKKIDSNAYNFKSLVSSSVNPQTGQLSTNVTLGHLNAHQLAPDFTLAANYSQSSQANAYDLGEGWSLNLTTYDIVTNTLHTSNGSSYRVIPTISGKCIYSLPTGVSLPNVSSCSPQKFQYHKLHDIVLNVYRTSSGNFAGAQVIYTDGHREIIDRDGRLIQIIYPHGFSVTFNYTGSPIIPLPLTISDNFGDQIKFQNDVSQVVSTVDGKQHVVSLEADAGASNLLSVSEGDNGQYKTQFSYLPSSPTQPQINLLQGITYPSGAKDLITYNNGNGVTGGLPVTLKEAPHTIKYLPVVTQMESIPSTPNEKPTFVTYSYGKAAYPTYNYTGYPKYPANSTEDVLFANPAQFLYETTESVSQGHNDNNAIVEKITRVYERHHYLMEEKVQRFNSGTGKSTPVKEVYYSYCSGVNPGPVGTDGKYPGQSCILSTPGTLPVTSGLPAAVQTVSYDQAGNQRTTQVLTQYDDSGNVTASINCSDADVDKGTCSFGKTTSSIVDK